MRTNWKHKELVITCPNCGREYLPCEIYLPNSFLGRVKNINRLEGTRVDTYDGKSMDLEEKYMCDRCNTQFIVTADVKFTTTTDAAHSFNSEYSTPLVKNNLFMDED